VLAFVGSDVAGMQDRFARCGERPMRPCATTRHGSVEPWSWWAHLVGARSIHIDKHWPDDPLQEDEDLMNERGGVGEKSFLKVKPLVTVTATTRESAGQ